MKAEWTNRDNLSINITGQNSKAILVIDMPKNCNWCPLHHYVLDDVLNEWFVNCQLDTFVDEDEKRPSQCPLRPMPEKNTWDVTENGHVTEFAEGWNACLEELEKWKP